MIGNPTLQEADLLELRQKQKRKKKIASEILGTAGLFFPFFLKRALAKSSSRWGYLFHKQPDFQISDYYRNLSVHINVKSNIEREMLTGKYDQELLKVIEKTVHPGMICLDIGANVGALTLPLAREVGPKGHVYAFEPGPVFSKRLKANLKLNPTLEKRVTVFPCGLSYEPGELFWNEDPEFPGNAWLLGEKGTKVSVKTLDSILLPLNLPRLDWIKVDVEGMESEVLKGARETLKRYHPQIVFESSIEFEAIRKRPVRKELFEELESLDYKILGIGHNGEFIPQTYPHLLANSVALPLGQKSNA